MRSYVRSMAMATPTSRIASPTSLVPGLLTRNLTEGERLGREEGVLDGSRRIRRGRTGDGPVEGEEGERCVRGRRPRPRRFIAREAIWIGTDSLHFAV